jgi:DNA repair protein RecO (recombination protein O)
MVQYAKYLGFSPMTNYDDKHRIFNLNEGIFQQNKPLTAEFLDYPYSESISKMLNTNFEEIAVLNFSKSERRFLLEKMIVFYRLHHTNFAKINSHLVLQEVFG